jgi:BTB/POZ domain
LAVNVSLSLATLINNSTLTSEPDSMLARMFNGQLDSATDAHGRVFIDRDGGLFATVLEYLRNADYELPESMTKDQLKALRREADFFQLRGLGAAIERALAVLEAASAAAGKAAADAVAAVAERLAAELSKPPPMEYRLKKIELDGSPNIPCLNWLIEEEWQVQCAINRPARGQYASNDGMVLLARAIAK